MTASELGFLGPEGELTSAIAAFDWATTPLGPIGDWSAELRTAVSIMMGSDYPGAIWWGRDLTLINNVAYELELLRERGRSFGRTFDAIWGDVAALVRPQFDAVLSTGRGMSWVDQRIDMLRDGAMTETYWNYSFTPVLDREGTVLGLFNGARETTDRVVAERVNALLIDLDAAYHEAVDIDGVVAVTIKAIGERLGVQRAGFSEIDEAHTAIIERPDWTDGSVALPPRQWPTSFDNEIKGLDSGGIIVVDDIYADPRFKAPEARGYFERLGMRAAIVCPVHDGSQAVGGLFVQSRSARRWSHVDLKLVRATADRLWHALRRMRAEIARQASEHRYRLIFEQAEDIIFTADINQTITDCNASGARALGMAREEILGRSIADFVNEQDFAQTTAMLRHKIEHGGNTRHEVDVTGRDGRRMRWDNNSTLIVDRDNKPTGLLSISRDVTEQRAFDERRELLINELNHRVKNTLTLVQAIALQSFRSENNSDSAASREFLGRLHTLAAAHDLLTREHWEGVTLAELVRAALDPLDRDGARIAAGGPDIRLTPKAAVALAMALHELGTNAVKYGALSVPGGRVDLHWREGDKRIAIDWREHGGPPVAAPARRGFGVRMIERVLAGDIAAKVAIDFAPGGVHCAIDAPEQGNRA